MSKKQLYYRESQKFSLGGLFFIAAIGCPVAIFIGGVYALAVYWIPFVFLHILFLYLAGYGLGFMANLLVVFNRVRNTAVNLLTGLGLGVTALYAYWVSWLYLASERQLFLLDPFKIQAFVALLAEQGGQSIQRRGRSFDIPAEMTAAAWLGEALILIGMAVYFGYKPARSRAFCEACQQWMSPLESLLPLKPAGDKQTFKQELEQGEWQRYLNLGVSEHGDIDCIVSHGLGCESCDARLLTVQSVFFSRDRKGKEKQRVKSIVHRLKIMPEQWVSITSRYGVTPADEADMPVTESTLANESL